MRLINTRSYQIENFLGETKPPYAILSHTWGEEEVSYQDMLNQAAESKAGFEKIKLCCEKARDQHYDYAWVDTCCIDRTSSAELSEAINSMYRWYGEAQVCYVYLADVEVTSPEEELYRQLRQSRWFTRGWTLQELIAPRKVLFYDKSKEHIGTRSTLAYEISKITRIDPSALHGSYTNLEHYSVAQRMSWAAYRKTTKPEDRAYSLIGIFDVNMTLLYGEGDKAFARLQRKIIKSTHDRSIFACTAGHNEDGLFALSADQFAESTDFQEIDNSSITREPIRVTGTIIEAMMKLSPDPDKSGEQLAFVGCTQAGTGKYVCIRLRKLPEWGPTQFWQRVNTTSLDLVSRKVLDTFTPRRVSVLPRGRMIQSWKSNLFPLPIPAVNFRITTYRKLQMKLFYVSSICHPSGLDCGNHTALSTAGLNPLNVCSTVLHNINFSTKFRLLPISKSLGEDPCQVCVLVLQSIESTSAKGRPLDIAVVFEVKHSRHRTRSSLYIDEDPVNIRWFASDPILGWERYEQQRHLFKELSDHGGVEGLKKLKCGEISLGAVGDTYYQNPTYEVWLNLYS